MGLFDFLKKPDDRYTFRREDGSTYYNPPGQHMIILKDSMDLLEKTTNPDTFFSRAKLAREKALYCEHESQIIWKGMNCKKIYKMLETKESASVIHRQFIDRLFSTGKEDNLTFQLHEVGYNMSEKTLNYFLQRLNGKMYRFCKVRFSNTSKLYTYITKDYSIEKGDMVTVSTSNRDGQGIDLVQVVEVFDAPLDELGFPITSMRCIKGKFNIVCPKCGANMKAV